jgi:hypothetical protein
MNPVFKNDAYKKSRGGYSRLLAISCESCGALICHYQKDGPGILRRMYLDRISGSSHYVGLQHTKEKDIPNLLCTPCDRVLGVCVTYEKEQRLAYRLFVGAVTKKIIKAKK